jgi:hypothetical protein
MGLKHFIKTHSLRWMILSSGKALPATFVHYLRMFGFLVRLWAGNRFNRVSRTDGTGGVGEEFAAEGAIPT